MGKAVIYYLLLMIIAIGSVLFFINRNITYSDKYDSEMINEIQLSASLPTMKAGGYQSRLAIIPDGQDVNADDFVADTYATLLVDNENNVPIVSFNSLRRIYPASTTKLMTGIVVCDALYSGKISLDDQITLSHDIQFYEDGVLTSPLKAGYTISVRNLLYGLLMRSYNDFAVILAEYVAGDQATFCDMMNQKAYEIGATNCHFANPHGLHDDNHYVTAYDMYLILQEAEKYDIIKEIDSYDSFTYSFTDADGVSWEDDISPTNQFLAGNYQLPSNIKIDSWKTGTTRLAGHILTMNVEVDGKKYSLFVADGTSEDDLYNKIGTLFNLTN